MRYWDITPIISPELAVFPGDTAFSKKILMDYSLGNHLQLSKIETTLHLGAHADSSSHYHPEGDGIDKRELSRFLGNVQVIEVALRKNERIRLEDIENKKISARRVIFKTNSFPDPNHWNDDFMSLSPELVESLAKKTVLMIGIDTPSVDPMTSKHLESHQALYKNKMAVLEGLVLEGVSEGVYSLIALPLPIKGADASPVRAILLEKAGLFDEDLVPSNR